MQQCSLQVNLPTAPIIRRRVVRRQNWSAPLDFAAQPSPYRTSEQRDGEERDGFNPETSTHHQRGRHDDSDQHAVQIGRAITRRPSQIAAIPVSRTQSRGVHTGPTRFANC